MVSRKQGPARAGNALLRWIAIGVVAFVMVACRGSQDGVTLTETRLESNPAGGRTVAGTLHNNTNAPFAYVQIAIDLLRPDGSVLGQTFAFANNLGGLETQKFEAPILAAGATGARIVKLTCRREVADADPPSGQKPLCSLDHPIDLK